MNDNRAQKLKRKTKNYSSKLKTFTLLAVTLCFVLFVLRFASPAFASTNSLSHQIVVTASIGEPRLTLFGYTSPFAQVSLQGGTGLYAETMANSQGYFIFEKLFVLQKLSDYCLYAQDREGRISNPVCLPPLPDGPFVLSIGPVILPPTLSLSKGQFLPGENVLAEGETIPNTETAIAFFRKEKSPLFIRRIYAFSLPEYSVSSDRNGYFSFNLPSLSKNTYRLYASALWNNKDSPKSNTLTFKILTIWEWFLEMIKEGVKIFIFKPFQSSNLNLIICCQIILILFLLKQRGHLILSFKSKSKPKAKLPILI